MKLRNQHIYSHLKNLLTNSNKSIINQKLLLKLMASEQREFACWQPLFRRLVLLVVLSVPASFLITIPFGPIGGLLSLALLLPATLFNLTHRLKWHVLARCDKDKAFCRQAVESGLLTNESANAATDYPLASVSNLIRA